MFNFLHPVSVFRRRPVAELSVKRASSLRDAENLDVFTVTGKPATVRPIHHPDVEFVVSYRLPEYLSFVREHGPVIAARVYAARGKPFSGLSSLHLVLVQAFAAIGFYVKKWRLKSCTFTVSVEGVRRQSALGTKFVPWNEFAEVHEYSQGFMVCLHAGAMPLPYRCLSAAKKVELCKHFATWRARYQPAT